MYVLHVLIPSNYKSYVPQGHAVNRPCENCTQVANNDYNTYNVTDYSNSESLIHPTTHLINNVMIILIFLHLVSSANHPILF